MERKEAAHDGANGGAHHASLRALRLMWAWKALSTSLLWSRFSVSFSPCATSDEKRKKLNNTTSKTMTFLGTSTSVSQKERFSRLHWPRMVRERPTKTAIVKREFMFTNDATNPRGGIKDREARESGGGTKYLKK